MKYKENVLKALNFVEKNLARRAPSVPRESGEALGLILFLEASVKKNLTVLELGGAFGYSTLWMLKGMTEANADGVIYTVEIDEDRANSLISVLEKYNLGDKVKVIKGDAGEILKKWDKKIDVLFLDAEKHKYLHYLKKVEPMLKENALVLAHNVIDFKSQMTDFLEEIKNIEKWRTTIYTVDPAGLSISRLALSDAKK